MNKIIYQISLILLIITIGITSVFISQVNAASIAGLNVSSGTEGETFTVSLILPDNAYGANCNVEVIYSDGTKTTVGTGGETGIAFVKGMEAMGFSNSITFSAKVAGTTQIKATSIVIVDENNTFLENGGSKEQTITIQSNKPVTPPSTQPDKEPSTNNNNGNNENNNNSNNNDASSNGNNTPSNNANTNTSKENTAVKDEKPKEPEVVNPTFKEVKEIVYATKGCNVRSSCSTDISSNKIGGLIVGQAVTRTGIEDTWSRIEFNGKIAYVATRLLSTEKPVDEEPENITKENTVTNTLNNNTVENIITNDIVDNTTVENEITDEQMLNQIEQEIGVLPEVGHNIASIIFVIISICSLIIIMKLQYKSIE